MLRGGATRGIAGRVAIRVSLLLAAAAAVALVLPGSTVGLRRGESPAATAPARRAGPPAGASLRALSDPYFGLSTSDDGDGRLILVPLSTTAEPEAPEPAAPEEQEEPEEDPVAADRQSGRAGQEEQDRVAWTVEPQPYYSWMWGDADLRPAPLDLGHGGADPEPARWSPWLGREAAMEDLQLYRTADNLNRPVEMRIAAAAGQLPRDEVEGKLLPGSKRFLSRFASVDEAIDYLSRGGAVLRRRWQEAEEQSASQAASMPIFFNATGEGSMEAGGEQPGEEGGPEDKTHRRSDARLEAPAPPSQSPPPPQMKARTAEGPDVGAWVGYLGYLGFVPCFACLGWLAFRLLCKRNCRDLDIVTSAGEEESSASSEEDTENEGGAPNPWQAFMGAPRDAEMRKLLLFPEKDGPQELPPLPDDESKAPPNPAQRPAAEAEVERILSTREQRDIFGPGDAIARKQEFRRLLLLLHPDKRLVAGDRAGLALRRVVEAYRALAAEP